MLSFQHHPFPSLKHSAQNSAFVPPFHVLAVSNTRMRVSMTSRPSQREALDHVLRLRQGLDPFPDPVLLRFRQLRSVRDEVGAFALFYASLGERGALAAQLSLREIHAPIVVEALQLAPPAPARPSRARCLGSPSPHGCR